jgi:hypothetical protein
MLRDFSRRLLDGTGGTGGTGDGGAAAAAAAAQAAAAAATPWHGGKVDADTLGWWQIKGYDTADPVKLTTELTKQYREAEKFIGAPASQLLKLPKDLSDEAGWNAVYQRLGAPADAKEYDFSTVKRADGQAPDTALLDTIRATAASLRLPKDKAPDLATAVVKHLDGIAAERVAADAAKLATEKAALAASWGTNGEMNKLQAMQGAKRLGVDPETVASLEKSVGYAKVMEMFRKIGAATSEDTFVEGRAGAGAVSTVEGAKARLNELTADKAWGKRFEDRDPAAVREFQNLTQLIAAAA